MCNLFHLGFMLRGKVIYCSSLTRTSTVFFLFSQFCDILSKYFFFWKTISKFQEFFFLEFFWLHLNSKFSFVAFLYLVFKLFRSVLKPYCHIMLTLNPKPITDFPYCKLTSSECIQSSVVKFHQNSTRKIWFRPIQRIFDGKTGPNLPHFKKQK